MRKFYSLDKPISRRKFLKASLTGLASLSFFQYFANAQQEGFASNPEQSSATVPTTDPFSEALNEEQPINTYMPVGSILRKSTPNQTEQKCCILLHGWNSKGVNMHRLRDALYKLPEAVGWDFISPSYESHFKSFKDNAKDLIEALTSLNFDLETTILIGYSTGGLVARQMVAEGFPCKALVTICTPHEGLLPWVTTPDITSMSLHMFSQDLAELNQNHKDIDSRHIYHLFGIHSKDLGGFHYDDGVVELNSALGMNIFQDVASRQSIQLDYDFMAGGDPHIKGMDPTYLTGFTVLGQQILAKF